MATLPTRVCIIADVAAKCKVLSMAKKQINAATTAAIYARYSSAAQNDASIEQQVAECTKYAQANNLTVITTYEDRAISGKTDKRPGFQRMVRAAERHEFQVLLTYKSNRIARNMYDALRYEAKLEAAGVRVVYCKEDFGDNAAGRMALRVMMSLNEFYSDNMAEDIRRGLRDSASKGRVVGAIPYGYKRGEDGRPVIDETTAPIVREMFERVMNDEAYIDIARDFNTRGIRTQRGGKWGKNSFRTILQNERYTGTYIYGDIRIEGGMPAIITPEVFAAVRKVTETRGDIYARHRDNGDYLLTGKLFCGKCLNPMIGISGHGRHGGLYFYYSCQGHRLHHLCDKKNVQKAWLEEEVTRAVQTCVLKDDTIEWIADTVMRISKEREDESQLAYYENRLKENKKQQQNILRAVEMGIITDEFKNRAAELQREKDELEAQIAVEKMKTLQVDRDHVVHYLYLLRNGDPKDVHFQRAIIRDFVMAVYLYDDYFKLVINFTGKQEAFICRLDTSPSDTDSSDAGVRIRDKVSHHTYVIRTPNGDGTLAATASGFVLTWHF